jgi:hypothetical protein
MDRRTFFRSLAGVPAAAAWGRAMAKKPDFIPVDSTPPFIAADVIRSALRQLGVLAPGEIAPQSVEDAALFHLRGLLAERRWVSQSHLSCDLAWRLAPEYCLRFRPPAAR